MIYVDISAAVHGRAGLGRYASSLALALDKEFPNRIALFYRNGSEGQVPKNLREVPGRSIRLGYKPWRMLVYLANLTHLSFRRFLPDCTLFHSTEHLLVPVQRIPSVLTVHDLIFRRFPEYHKKQNYLFLNLAMPLFCRRSSAIIAVSEATKADLIHYYGIEASKIHVVYEAAGSQFKPPAAAEIARVRELYELPDRYLLHLSTIEPRKNLDRLVDALMVLREDFTDLALILIGGKGWLCQDFIKRIESPDIAGFVKALGWVPDDDLPALIGAASLAVQPSIYEGFGLPILEHMACGQVVAASEGSSHPEVGGAAAAYFNPLEVGEMIAVIRRLLQNKDEYQERRELGLRQSRKFNWQRAANETMAIYNDLLDKAV